MEKISPNSENRVIKRKNGKVITPAPQKTYLTKCKFIPCRKIFNAMKSYPIWKTIFKEKTYQTIQKTIFIRRKYEKLSPNLETIFIES